MRQESHKVSVSPTVGGPGVVASTQSPTPVCLLVAGRDGDCHALLERLQRAAGRVLVARTPFEAVVKATFHEPGAIVLDPSLGRSAVAETRTLLAQCPMTAHLPIVVLTARRSLPRRVLAALAA